MALLHLHVRMHAWLWPLTALSLRLLARNSLSYALLLLDFSPGKWVCFLVVELGRGDGSKMGRRDHWDERDSGLGTFPGAHRITWDAGPARLSQALTQEKCDQMLCGSCTKSPRSFAHQSTKVLTMQGPSAGGELHNQVRSRPQILPAEDYGQDH